MERIMTTKYEFGATVYYFDPSVDRIVSDHIAGINIGEEGAFYVMDNELILPERALFSCELQCRMHYQKIFA